MQPWKISLAYDGSAFHGWQIQPRLPTIQGFLAAALHHITGETVLPQGSGRTDTGVHALAQVASFSLAAPIPPANLLRALNRALPSSIRVLSALHATTNFHARHSALRKTYEYRIFPGASLAPHDPEPICPPMLAPYVWVCPWPFSLELAQRAAAQIIGEHDFTSFAAADPDLAARREDSHSSSSSQRTGSLCGQSTPSTRTIFHSAWRTEWEPSTGRHLVVYRITGSGFLHHMVRNLVGTFVEAAAGRSDPKAIPQILVARNRSAAGPTAPARGLFLVEVLYPE